MAGDRPCLYPWLFSLIVALVAATAAFLILSSTLRVYAQDGSPPNCTACHQQPLKGHDKLGPGNPAACVACHAANDMKMLRLASGETLIPLAESPTLCAECHQSRYAAWQEGTHGIAAWKEGSADVRGSTKLGCVSCHNPHQPQIAFSNVTKPHPAPVPPPPPPPNDLLIIAGISLTVLTGISLITVKWSGMA